MMTMALMPVIVFRAVHAPSQPPLYCKIPYFRNRAADGSLRRLEFNPGSPEALSKQSHGLQRLLDHDHGVNILTQNFRILLERQHQLITARRSFSG